MKREDIEKIFRGRKPGTIGRHKDFAVLVPFVEKEDGLFLMYEVRALDMETQPGEVCFPGGHVEPGETPLQCALRETREETGIPEDAVDVIGPADVLYGFSGFTLYPFVGIVPNEWFERAVPEKSEVSRVFLLRADELAEKKPERYPESFQPVVSESFPYDRVGIDEDYPWRTGRSEILVYGGTDPVLWGITARITENVLETMKAGSRT